jgi:hypothetical protein
VVYLPSFSKGREYVRDDIGSTLLSLIIANIRAKLPVTLDISLDKLAQVVFRKELLD